MSFESGYIEGPHKPTREELEDLFRDPTVVHTDPTLLQDWQAGQNESIIELVENFPAQPEEEGL